MDREASGTDITTIKQGAPQLSDLATSLAGGRVGADAIDLLTAAMAIQIFSAASDPSDKAMRERVIGAIGHNIDVWVAEMVAVSMRAKH